MSSFAWGLFAGLFLGFLLGFMAAAVLAMSHDPIFPEDEEEGNGNDT